MHHTGVPRSSPPLARAGQLPSHPEQSGCPVLALRWLGRGSCWDVPSSPNHSYDNLTFMAAPIEDYALIGDCETAALVSRHGSIDWLCWPTFASPACFAALLGSEDNGHWSIAPKSNFQSTRRYLDHTLVLETTFETETGSAVLVDFMPPRNRNSDVVRIVRGVRGSVDMHMDLVLRFDYGRSVPWVTRMDDRTLRAIAGPDMTALHTLAPVRGEDLTTVSDFTIAEGESLSFVLTYAPSHDKLPHPVNPDQALHHTLSF